LYDAVTAFDVAVAFTLGSRVKAMGPPVTVSLHTPDTAALTVRLEVSEAANAVLAPKAAAAITARRKDLGLSMVIS
jgi:hypothetical protein